MFEIISFRAGVVCSILFGPFDVGMVLFVFLAIPQCGYAEKIHLYHLHKSLPFFVSSMKQGGVLESGGE